MPKPQYGAEHRARRAAWLDELTRTGGRQCACRGQCGRHRGRCREWITAEGKWHLMHGLAHIRGGDGTDSEPGCPTCNLAEVAKLRDARGAPSASEEWW